MAENIHTPEQASRREWVGLCVLSIACLIYSMDLSVLFLAVPAIVADLNPSASQLLWINDIYGFMVAGFLVTMGTLGDRIGRRRVLLMGAFAFGVASAFAAFSNTPGQLILARALLGIAGATIAPSTLSLIVNLFKNEAERNRAISIWGTAFALGGLVGPLIGGILLQYFHWGSVFLINIPVMLLLLAVAPFLLPEYKNNDAGRLDLLSVVLSLATVLPIIYGFKHMAADGFQLAQVVYIGLGLLVGLLFVRRQRRLSDPLVDLALFRVPAFTASLMVNLAGVFFVFGVFLFQNLFLQLVLGLSPLEAALWSAPSAFVFAVMSFQAYASQPFGPVRTVLGGLLINAAGAAAMAVAAYAESLIGILGSSMIIGFGFVPVVLTTTGLIVGTAPPERAGSASAISETSAEFGGALGIAVLGSLATLVYRMAMNRADLSSLNPVQAEAVSATLAGAVETARSMPGSTSAVWLETAKSGFSLGFAVCCVVATVTLLLLAIVARRVYATAHIDESTLAPH
ncbi:MFS transporter [Sinorhizobium meliloti CCBAU 01290]|nr:MFS transporter [Sinorhizobium meliloti CCBAU 01290]